MDPNFYTGSPGRRRQLPQVPNDYAAIPNPAISPAIPMQPTPTYSPTRQNLHLNEMSNPYPTGPASPILQMRPQSPSRQGLGVHASAPMSPIRPISEPHFENPNNNSMGDPSVYPTPRAMWTRLESPVRDNTPVMVDDEDTMGNSLRSTRGPVPKFEGFGHRSTDSNTTAVYEGGPPSRTASAYHSEDAYSYNEHDEDGFDQEDDDFVNSHIGNDEADRESQSELLSVISADTLNSSAYQVPAKAQPRRNKSMSRREVKLVRGNLVLDCPVPTKLYSFLPRRDHDEFVYMRYTAATTDPDDFAEGGFTLRPAIYEREIQLCICITMYNEDEIAFTRTMHAVMKNIAHLCNRNKSRVWGKDGWKKVVVSIVADGRTKINPGVLNVLAAMGIFQEGIAKNYVNGNEVKAHIFEYTTQVSIGSDLKFQGAEKGLVPVQVLFCLKEKNAKKINSHRWLFNAFCPVLNPNVCILLDVGTKPGPTSIYHLWKTFDADSNIGGACGEIKAMTGPGGVHLLNPLVAAQNFEYKMSNILDKPLESVFGYITVLPGALSAYRYIALKNGPDGKGPLASYFKGEFLHGSEADVFTSNMYLAEDRILCWELVAKKGEKWLLKYVKSANGETDVPDDVPEFVSQRRRWLNGALFAAIYAQTHFTQIWQTDHSIMRKIMLHIEFFYQFVQLIFTFFSLANFYLAFYFVAGSLTGPNDNVMPGRAGYYLFLVFNYIFICTIATQFVISLGNRPQGSRHFFYASFILLGLVGMYGMGCGIYFVVRTIQQSQSGATLGNNAFTNIVVSMVSTYGLYVLMSVLYFDPWHIITSSVQYFLLLPSYICTLQVYAFCNTHDVTWGTKGDNDQKMDLGSAVVKAEAGKDIVEMEMPTEQVDIDQGYEDALTSLREPKNESPASSGSSQTTTEDYYREFRTRVVLVWMIANIILALIMMEVFDLQNTNSNVYLKIILWSVAGLAAFRAIGSFAYLIQMVVKYLSDTRDRSFKRDAFTGGKIPATTAI